MRNIHEQLMNNPKIPWYREGVNPNNKKQWLSAVLRQNPWLMEDLYKERHPEPRLFPADQAHIDSIKAEQCKI